MWSEVLLSEILSERREVPDAEALALGSVRVVAKIAFDTGAIEFRTHGRTETGMILIRPGDLVLSGINATKGSIAIYDESNAEVAAATIHYGAYAVQRERADPAYLWWYFRSGAFRTILLHTLPNGIKTELKASRLLPIRIPLPSLAEQRSIVADIERVRMKIEASIRARRNAATLTRLVMQALMTREMAAWPTDGHLADVVEFKPRAGPSFVTHSDWTGTPVLMPSSVTGFGVDLTKREFGPGGELINEKDRLQPGDILIARGNKREQVGNAGIVPEEAAGWVCANLLMRMRLDPGVADPRFCIYWLRSPRMRDYVRSHMTGTNPNIQKINQRTVLGFPYPSSVPLAQQDRTVTRLDSLQRKVDTLVRLQRETQVGLSALLASILDRAFKGI